MNSFTEFVEVNGQKIPLNLYLAHMNRKQRRQFEAERKKKNSHIKVIRVDNVVPEKKISIEEEINNNVPEQVNTSEEATFATEE
jgi:hypothetical protein